LTFKNVNINKSNNKEEKKKQIKDKKQQPVSELMNQTIPEES